MASIKLNQVGVEFPIYNSTGRSLKRSLLRLGVGGTISADVNDRVVVKALQDVSLTLADGDRLGLVGHNGAGKSTLLRVMSGIFEPTTGTVEIVGSVSSLTDIMLGMDPEATGLENIILRSVFLGVSIKQAHQRADEIAEFSELGGYVDLPLRTYSSGMVLRLAFAVSTSVFPEILIMDEMIGAGDAKFVEKARGRVNEMIDRARIMVLASHDEGMIRSFCNKAMLLAGGRVVASGSPEEMFSAYRVASSG